MKQEIGFCTTPDGVRVAYARSGKGPPLVKAANWLNHLEFDWQSPVWRHWLEMLSRDHELIRYDERGNGLSDWDVDDISFDVFVKDLEAVVDELGLDRFPLLGLSQGCGVSIAYAVRHPERVSQLILVGGYAQGRLHRGPEEAEQATALLTLIRQGWGKKNPALRQLFTSSFIPGGTPEQTEWFNELQRVTSSPENAARIREACDRIDVTALLARVATPTLVIHCREDAMVPFEAGRRLAAGIPRSRFVLLESSNHVLLEDEAAWPRFVSEVRGFLGTKSKAGAAGTSAGRWNEVDGLLAGAIEQTRERRSSWLAEACGPDEALRREVLRLIELGESSDAELQPGGAMTGSLWSELVDELGWVRPDELQVGDRIGTYEIVGPIGRGGMGTVYRAKHPVLGRDVAVKALVDVGPSDGWRLRRFEREARLLASLNHPNIAIVHDFVVLESRPYLILELVEGETLDVRLARGPLAIEEVLSIGSQIADAMEEAHRKGVVHRDLKPANVKLTPDNRVKVLDFGLAKLYAIEGVDAAAAPKPRSSYATQSGMILGTPGYMSPEQTRGGSVDERADVWAFGCLVYEMLTCERAFQGATVSDAIASVLRDDVDWSRLPLRTPAPLRELLDRCLRKDPAKRLRELRSAWSAVTTETSPSGVPSRSQRVVAWWRRLGRSPH